MEISSERCLAYRLRSGRQIALTADPYLDLLASDSDETRYFAIVVIRLNVATPIALSSQLVVCYFGESRNALDSFYFNSGYCVADIFEGHSDWDSEEIKELKALLEDQLRVAPWVQAQFDEIDRAIRENPVWQSKLLMDQGKSNAITAADLIQTAILNSALESGAMAQLRLRNLNS